MRIETPDYAHKLSWAEHHLIELEGLVKQFEDLHPYEVAHTVEGKQQKDVYRLRFAAQPDYRLALITGDFLYNVRASLDYLVGALVPSSDRSHVMMPILREPVWEIPFAEGENQQRTTDRARWETVTRRMRPEAIAILQEMQPLDERMRPPNFHTLDLLNRLSNKDRHRQLGTVAYGVRDIDFSCELADGSLWQADGDNLNALTALQDGANIRVPPGTVNVHLRGTATVVIRGGEDGRHVLIPDRLRDMLHYARDAIVRLAPFSHISGTHSVT